MWRPIIPPARTQSGLLYVDWNDGTATDQTFNPATPSVGGSAIIARGAFFSQSPPTITSATEVTWAATKFNGLITTQAFTLEGKVVFTTVANGTVREIVRMNYGTVGIPAYFDIAFLGTTPPNIYLAQAVGGSGRITLVSTGGLTAGVEYHFALVVPAGATPTVRLYSGSGATGSLIGSAASSSLFNAVTNVLVGNPSDQGTENYAIDWLRLSAGELYTGSSYTIPTNS